jgi:hypothetical protein
MILEKRVAGLETARRFWDRLSSFKPMSPGQSHHENSGSPVREMTLLRELWHTRLTRFYAPPISFG